MKNLSSNKLYTNKLITRKLCSSFIAVYVNITRKKYREILFAYSLLWLLSILQRGTNILKINRKILTNFARKWLEVDHHNVYPSVLPTSYVTYMTVCIYSSLAKN